MQTSKEEKNAEIKGEIQNYQPGQFSVQILGFLGERGLN